MEMTTELTPIALDAYLKAMEEETMGDKRSSQASFPECQMAVSQIRLRCETAQDSPPILDGTVNPYE